MTPEPMFQGPSSYTSECDCNSTLPGWHSHSCGVFAAGSGVTPERTEAETIRAFIHGGHNNGVAADEALAALEGRLAKAEADRDEALIVIGELQAAIREADLNRDLRFGTLRSDTGITGG